MLLECGGGARGEGFWATASTGFGLDFDFGVAGADPIDKLIGAAHGGESALADEREVGEQVRCLDGVEGGRRLESAEEGEVDDRGFWVFGVGAGGRVDTGEPDDGGISHAVVDEDFVTFLHGADGLDGLGVGDPVPDGFDFFFKIGNALVFRVGLGEVVTRGRHKNFVLLLCSRSS